MRNRECLRQTRSKRPQTRTGVSLTSVDDDRVSHRCGAVQIVQISRVNFTLVLADRTLQKCTESSQEKAGHWGVDGRCKSQFLFGTADGTCDEVL